MKFLRLTQPSGQPIAVRGDLIETMRPQNMVPSGEPFIIGTSQVSVGALLVVGRNSYLVAEPVDTIVAMLVDNSNSIR